MAAEKSAGPMPMMATSVSAFDSGGAPFSQLVGDVTNHVRAFVGGVFDERRARHVADDEAAGDVVIKRASRCGTLRGGIFLSC